MLLSTFCCEITTVRSGCDLCKRLVAVRCKGACGTQSKLAPLGFILMPDVCILLNGFHSLGNIFWWFEGSTTMIGKTYMGISLNMHRKQIPFFFL